MRPSRSIDDLLALMHALRDPATGCPWDVEQNFSSIAPYTLEEAYEVVDAIERNDPVDLCDELGDLLLQIVFHAQMAQEQNLFAFPDVVEAITTKLIRRHPHVFGDTRNLGADEVKKLWADIKAQEKAERARTHGTEHLAHINSRLDGVPKNLPALTRAVKLQNKASTCGFDWHEARAVLAKIREETDEIEHALDDQLPHDHLKDEIGDLFFALANLARHLDVDPETAVRASNEKFCRRFAYIERAIEAEGEDINTKNLAQLERLWQQAKTAGL